MRVAREQDQTEADTGEQPDSAPQHLFGAEFVDGHLAARLFEAPPRAAGPAENTIEHPRGVAHDRPQDAFKGRERRARGCVRQQARFARSIAKVRCEPVFELRTATAWRAIDRERHAEPDQTADPDAGERAHLNTRSSTGRRPMRIIIR